MPSSSLPTAFTRLWAASAITNLGDGALLAAGPLLVATVTSDPAAVAAGMFAQQLPWLLFALVSGALADRLPRRALVLAVSLVRGLALTFLAVAITVDEPRLWLIYPVLFLLGVGETLADSAYGALVADTVPGPLLGRANARIHLTFSLNNQLIGPPLGALLFTVAAALPIGFHALAQFFAVIVFAKLAVEYTVDRSGKSLRSDVAAGLRWLWRHPGLRLLTFCILVMNLTSVGVFAVWVLYATEHLGLTATQYGLFISVSALGSIAGAWAYGRLEARFGHVTLLRAGLVIEALTYAALTLTREPLIAGLIMMLFGAHAAVWGTVATTVRQRATPSALMGRVGSVYHLASVGGAAIGALTGGFVAREFGLLAPFWIAAVAIGALTVLVWRRLPSTAP